MHEDLKPDNILMTLNKVLRCLRVFDAEKVMEPNLFA